MKTVVVTGAGSGVGQGIALKFAAEGWQVALVGRRLEPLRVTATLAGEAAGARIAFFQCDVSRADEVAAMGEAVLARFGSVDVLVNSAGINVPRRGLDVLSLDDWHAVLRTNLDGVFHCSKVAADLLRDNGRIVNVASVAGLFPFHGQSNYAAAKAGVIALTKVLARELARRGITANAVAVR